MEAQLELALSLSCDNPFLGSRNIKENPKFLLWIRHVIRVAIMWKSYAIISHISRLGDLTRFFLNWGVKLRLFNIFDLQMNFDGKKYASYGCYANVNSSLEWL